MTDPINLFLERRRAAVAAGEPFEGTAAVLATVGAEGAPSARMVLVKEVGPDGFAFYTNRESRKGEDLAHEPRVALCFHFTTIDEQLRVEGEARPTSDARSDAYFAARPRSSQLGAWASPQSRELASRDELLARFDSVRAEHEGQPVPRPSSWGGYLVAPTRVEHWINREHRLHDRFVYELGPDETWTERRLAP